ncbi:L-rhamnose mutarotase [uncultured Draconibacterium sp.]|uniref:L-rhamnose mutarotase n=1 Tax=uncultured Draconibacterium sp. TaxID=1573823 RepID=UPI0025F08D9C|nr:L-rhamnose mutarotase [uncultured Draconibacterium sp.]
MQRICLTLDLKNQHELIEKYKFYHAAENHWREINDGIKAAGIDVMDIYLVDNRMFMICELADGKDFEKCWKNIGQYPRQDEWAELMNSFIQAVPGHKTEWVKMHKVFELK